MDGTTLAFSVFLVVVSAVLIASHLRDWRSEQELSEDDPHRKFAWSKFRRRMQASAMLGITGIAILGGQWLPDRPVVALVYWSLVALWVLWIALLALVDVVASRHHFTKMYRDQLVEQARLQVQLRRHQHEGNGHESTVSD